MPSVSDSIFFSLNTIQVKGHHKNDLQINKKIKANVFTETQTPEHCGVFAGSRCSRWAPPPLTASSSTTWKPLNVEVRLHQSRGRAKPERKSRWVWVERPFRPGPRRVWASASAAAQVKQHNGRGFRKLYLREVTFDLSVRGAQIKSYGKRI